MGPPREEGGAEGTPRGRRGAAEEPPRGVGILPILYKLFSRMLCGRLRQNIVSQQSVDQAAYREGFSTDDHLFWPPNTRAAKNINF